VRQYRLVRYRGVLCAAWHDGTGTRRLSLGTDDRALGEVRFQKFLSDVAKPEKKVVTVAQCLTGYYAARAAVIPRTALSFFASKLPADVSRADCESYARKRAKVARPKTIHTELGILRSALRWAEHEGWIDRAPYIHMPDPGQPRERWLTPEEATRLLDACGSFHVWVFVALALQTAARPGALLDLTWSQVRLDRGVIDFNPPGRARTAKGRPVVTITDEARKVLEKAQQAALTDYVIEWAGDRVQSVKRAFAAACERAGLQDVTPHTLRHTAATWMAEAGVEMREISKFLGHTSTDVTERVYAKHSPGYLRNAAAALAQFPVGQMNQNRGTNRKAGAKKTRKKRG
jgi:integrase